MDDSEKTVTTNSEQWTVNSEQWTVDSGQWTSSYKLRERTNERTNVALLRCCRRLLLLLVVLVVVVVVVEIAVVVAVIVVVVVGSLLRGVVALCCFVLSLFVCGRRTVALLLSLMVGGVFCCAVLGVMCVPCLSLSGVVLLAGLMCVVACLLVFSSPTNHSLRM